MNWHGPAGNTEPAPAADPGVSSCVWCGQSLPVACPSDDFGSDMCEARWTAWRNRVAPIEEPKPVPAVNVWIGVHTQTGEAA